jgi:hypothetical protein
VSTSDMNSSSSSSTSTVPSLPVPHTGGGARYTQARDAQLVREVQSSAQQPLVSGKSSEPSPAVEADPVVYTYVDINEGKCFNMQVVCCLRVGGSVVCCLRVGGSWDVDIRVMCVCE